MRGRFAGRKKELHPEEPALAGVSKDARAVQQATMDSRFRGNDAAGIMENN